MLSVFFVVTTPIINFFFSKLTLWCYNSLTIMACSAQLYFFNHRTWGAIYSICPGQPDAEPSVLGFKACLILILLPWSEERFSELWTYSVTVQCTNHVATGHLVFISLIYLVVLWKLNFSQKCHNTHWYNEISEK